MNAVKFLGECWTILCLFLLLRKQSDPFRILCCLLVKTFWFWSFFVNSGSSFFRLPRIVLPFILIIQITLLNDIYESASAKIFLYFYSLVITGFREPVWNKECPLPSAVQLWMNEDVSLFPLWLWQLPSVLWHCWLGVRKSIWIVKIDWWGVDVVICRGARCRLFAYGPADATTIPKPHLLLSDLNPDWFYLSGTGIHSLSRKRGR